MQNSFVFILIKKLNWPNEMNDVYFEWSRMCVILYKFGNHFMLEAVPSIYCTLCYPHLVYCVSLWACTGLSSIAELKVAQNEILRCIFHLEKFDSTVGTYSQRTSSFISIQFIIGFSFDLSSKHCKQTGNPNLWLVRNKVRYQTWQC